MSPIDVLWSRIVAFSGESFYLPGGRSFTYSVSGDTIHVDTVNTDLARWQITKAAGRMPLTGAIDVDDLPHPTHIYTLLTDRRITGN